MKLLSLLLPVVLITVGCNYSVDKASRPTGSTAGRPGGSSNGQSGGQPEAGEGATDPSTNLNFDFVFQNAIKTNCAGCHGAPRNAAGINLQTYENVFTHRGAVEAAVTSRFMPEGVGRTMPEEQRELLLEWLAAGAPREAVPAPEPAPVSVKPVIVPEVESPDESHVDSESSGLPRDLPTDLPKSARGPFVTPELLRVIVRFFAVPQALATIAGKEFDADPSGKATFEAIGKPSLLKIKSNEAPVTGRLELIENKVKGRFEVELARFETGMGLRDRHMKEKYLETEKFPKAVLEVQSVETPEGWKPGTELSAAKFKGLLTLKGVSKPIEGTVDVKGAEMAANAQFAISLKEFPVGVPSYMGVTVADNVNVDISIPSFKAK